MSRTRFVPLATLALAACASSPAATRGPVAPPARSMAFLIDSVADAPPLDHTTWGIEVRDQQTGRVLYQRNGNRHYIPASNTKLVVTLVAMGTLGPGYRYRTPIMAGESTGEGAVRGLVIAGRGDPTFSARFWGRPLAAAYAFADSIYAAGIRVVDGPLVIDASRFTDAMINGTWEVGDLPGGAAPPVAAFAIDESIFRVILVPGAAAGDPITLAWPGLPPAATGGQPISIARVRTDTVGARGMIQSDFLGRRDSIYLSGTVPAGRPDTASWSVTDPPLYAGRVIAAALAAKGVRLNGDVVVARDTVSAAEARRTLGELRMIATMTSPPMSEIVAAILQPSQNWIAETVLKTLGAELGTSGSWRGGIAVERVYLVENAGLDSLDFNLRDASGMAPQNLLSPRAITRMFDHARTSPWSQLYRDALAAPGRNGTLENRLREYEGRLWGKTGTISNVATLSGYLVTDGGREVTFSIMTNGTGLSSATVRRHADEIVRIIARETPR